MEFRIGLVVAVGLLTPVIASAQDRPCDTTTEPCSDGDRFLEAPWYTDEFPLESAIHLFPPMAGEVAEPGNLDVSLDPYVAITACIVGEGCDDLAATQSGPDAFRLRGHAYHVNWRPWDSRDRPRGGHAVAYTLDFYVAGLLVRSYSGELGSAGVVPIRYQIDNHPQIRARVLTEEGADSVQIAWVLSDEFGVEAEEASQLLLDEGFDATEITWALAEVFDVFAADAAWILSRRGFDATEIATALDAVYLVIDKDIARYLACPAFLDVDNVYVPFFDAEEIYGALKAVKDADFDSGACALQYAGFAGAEALRVTYDDLVEFYDPIIAEIGPELRVNPDEPFLPTYIDWYTTRTTLEDNKCGGVCRNPTANQIADITAAVDWATSLQAACEANGLDWEPSDVTCESETEDQRFFLRPEVHQATPETSAGAEHYVHIVRGDDWTDLQFWSFYAYNGWGYLQIAASFCIQGVCLYDSEPEPSAMAPIGEHPSDFEVVVLRLYRDAELSLLRDGVEEDLLEGATMSAHGEYFPGAFDHTEDQDFYSPDELEWTSDGHVIAYSSLNGHGAFPHVGSNIVHPLAQAEEELEDVSFSFTIPGGKIFPYPCPTWEKPWKICWVRIPNIPISVPMPDISMTFSAHSPNTTAYDPSLSAIVRDYVIVGAYDVRLTADHIDHQQRWVEYAGDYTPGGRLDFDDATEGLVRSMTEQIPVIRDICGGLDFGHIFSRRCPEQAATVEAFVRSLDLPFLSDVIAAALDKLGDACSAVADELDDLCVDAITPIVDEAFEWSAIFSDYDSLDDVLELIDPALVKLASVGAIGQRLCELDSDNAQWYYVDLPGEECESCEVDCEEPPPTCFDECRGEEDAPGIFECLRRCAASDPTVCNDACYVTRAECAGDESDCDDELAACLTGCCEGVCVAAHALCTSDPFPSPTCFDDFDVCLAECHPGSEPGGGCSYVEASETCTLSVEVSHAQCLANGPIVEVCGGDFALDCLAEANEVLSSCLLEAADCADVCFPDCMADCLGTCQDPVVCDQTCRVDCGLPVCCDATCEAGCVCCDATCGADCDAGP